MPPGMEKPEPKPENLSPSLNLSEQDLVRNNLVGWISENKSLTTALSVAFVFVGLLGFVLIADKPVNLLGIQLNPMYNKANIEAPCGGSVCPEEQPAPGPIEPTPGGGTGGGTTGNTITGSAPTGFQVSVRDIGCSEQQATSPVAGPNGSAYTTDTNQKDPDCARINFITPNVASIDTNISIYSNDFRIGTRLAESESGCTNQIDSQIRWTPWASDGGGTSPQAQGQSTSNDPDCVWIHYETRPMPAGKAIRDVRIGIASGSSMRFTNWARQGGGWSQYSSGSNLRPTSLQLEVQVFDVVAPININGTFSDGTVNQFYSTSLNLSGGANEPCTWNLDSITPAMPSAEILQLESTVTAVFRATPANRGNYQIQVTARCQNGQMAQQIFVWKVNDISTPSTLVISGSMPNGLINQDYTHAFVVSGNNSDSCSWSLNGVAPTVSGATIGSTNGRFSARPLSAHTYRVSVGVVCGNQRAENTFDWVVTTSGTSPTPGGGQTNGNKDTCLDPTQTSSLVAIYRYWSPSAGDHLYTTNSNERPVGYRFEGVSGYVYNRQMPNTKAIYRSAQRQIGSHYYTTENSDPSEYGYVDEGVLGYAYTQNVAGASAWYRLHKGGSTSDYVHTTNEQERVAVKELGYEDQGVVAYICGGDQSTQLQPIFRLWSSADSNHFYTTNFAERDFVLGRGYVSEGIAGYLFGVRKEGGAPLYRSYSTSLKDHFYTTNEQEARSSGYNLEGVLGYLSGYGTSGTTAFYRLFNPIVGDHFYTVSDSEANGAIQAGYIREGTAGHLYTQPQ